MEKMSKQQQAQSVNRIRNMKQTGEPIAMITAYDYCSARLAEAAQIDMILVGDSLGNVVLGYDSTVPVTIEDIIYHARAVRRGAPHTFIVADMPFMTYHSTVTETLHYIKRLMQKGHVNAIKMEGGTEIVQMVTASVQAGVPVLGHIGLTPQSVNQIGGYCVQGKTIKDARRLLADAQQLEQAGAFALVLELMTAQVATYISERIKIPTIGIGAGQHCNGQVLVYHDLLHYDITNHPKRFVKQYADIGNTIQQAITTYIQDVKQCVFPAPEHSFVAEKEVVAQLYKNEGTPL